MRTGRPRLFVFFGAAFLPERRSIHIIGLQLGRACVGRRVFSFADIDAMSRLIRVPGALKLRYDHTVGRKRFVWCPDSSTRSRGREPVSPMRPAAWQLTTEIRIPDKKKPDHEGTPTLPDSPREKPRMELWRGATNMPSGPLLRIC